MGKVGSVLAGMGILIGIFLFLTRGKETVSIISALGSTTRDTVVALQGRG
jgi:hypothetical protein